MDQQDREGLLEKADLWDLLDPKGPGVHLDPQDPLAFLDQRVHLDFPAFEDDLEIGDLQDLQDYQVQQVLLALPENVVALAHLGQGDLNQDQLDRPGHPDLEGQPEVEAHPDPQE